MIAHDESRRCTARAAGILPAPRCCHTYGHGKVHQDADGIVWVGSDRPCPCGYDDDGECECGIDRLAWTQKNEREDSLTAS